MLLAARTRSVALTSCKKSSGHLSVNQVLPSPFSESVRRLELPIDEHVGIIAPQQCFAVPWRAEPQIEIPVANRQPRPRGLADCPEQARAHACRLQRAAVDDHDLDAG